MYIVHDSQCTHYLDYLRLVAGADREHFKETGAGPQQFLVGVQSHDAHQVHRATAGQDDQLGGGERRGGGEEGGRGGEEGGEGGGGGGERRGGRGGEGGRSSEWLLEP